MARTGAWVCPPQSLEDIERVLGPLGDAAGVEGLYEVLHNVNTKLWRISTEEPLMFRGE